MKKKKPEEEIKVKKHFRYLEIKPVAELQGRIYVGKRSKVWDTDLMREVQEWVRSHPIAQEAAIIRGDNPQLQAMAERNKIKQPLLAFKRATRDWLKKNEPDYMVVTIGNELRIMRIDSQI